MEIGLLLLGFVVGQFLPSYIREKGKNLATKEDIGAITRKVEEVKSEYTEKLTHLSHQNNLIVEQFRSGSQMHAAMLLKRMEILQEAYVLWLELLHAVHKPEIIGEKVMDCQSFWEKNNLYLGADLRNKYKLAYMSAASHHKYVQWRESPDLIKENMQYIRDAGEAIVSAAELPNIENEFASIESM